MIRLSQLITVLTAELLTHCDAGVFVRPRGGARNWRLATRVFVTNREDPSFHGLYLAAADDQMAPAAEAVELGIPQTLPESR